MPSFPALNNAQLCELSPLQLAYIGDSVYDLLVRGSTLACRAKLRTMHLAAVSKVKASSQAGTLALLLPHLSETESDYVRKGRNAHAHHQAPKSASTADYAAATGLECLFGFLYVSGQEQRLMELFELSLSISTERD